MSDRYAIVGNPVAQSKSPIIQAEFARQTGEAIVYERLLSPLDGFAMTVEAFAQTGGKGLNVTKPFKAEAFALASECTERARLARAVNTLKRVGDHWFADNTDGAGLVTDLRVNLGVDLAGRRIAILGAGGAAHGIVKPMLDAGPASIVIANRTGAKGEALARDFAKLGPVVAMMPGELAQSQFDVIVNATSFGMHEDASGPPPCPASIFASDGFAYDLVYAPGDAPTPFVRYALANGASRAADGLGMLIEQAAESFFLWRGVRPDTKAMLTLMRGRAPTG